MMKICMKQETALALVALLTYVMGASCHRATVPPGYSEEGRTPDASWPLPEMDWSRTAVIVVDMQNAFASRGGMLDKLGSFSERNRDVIKPIREVIDVARTAAIKVIYLRMVYKPDLSDAGGPDSPNYWKLRGLVAMRENPEFRGEFLIDGQWDAEIIEELRPREGDVVIDKTRYSGFTNTELDSLLSANNIKYLVFTGIATNVCVESTLRSAFFNGYFPILLSDACVPVGPVFVQDATVFNVETFFGWVATSRDFINALRD